MKADGKISLDSISEEVFGISSRRYRQLAKDFQEPTGEIYIPEPKSGKIDFHAAVKGLLSYYRKLAEGDGSIGLTEARQRKVSAEARLKELELMVQEGKLIPREGVLQEFLNRISMFKSALMVLHKLLPLRLKDKDPREMAIIIKKAENDIMTRYSRKGGVLK